MRGCREAVSAVIGHTGYTMISTGVWTPALHIRSTLYLWAACKLSTALRLESEPLDRSTKLLICSSNCYSSMQNPLCNLTTYAFPFRPVGPQCPIPVRYIIRSFAGTVYRDCSLMRGPTNTSEIRTCSQVPPLPSLMCASGLIKVMISHRHQNMAPIMELPLLYSDFTYPQCSTTHCTKLAQCCPSHPYPEFQSS